MEVPTQIMGTSRAFDMQPNFFYKQHRIKMPEVAWQNDELLIPK